MKYPWNRYATCPDCTVLQKYFSLKAVLHFYSKTDSFVTIRNTSTYCCFLLSCFGLSEVVGFIGGNMNSLLRRKSDLDQIIIE